jgi:1,4-alpha-glucan branching enzyme
LLILSFDGANLHCRRFALGLLLGWKLQFGSPVERKKLMAKKTKMKSGINGRTQTFSFRASDASSVQLVGDFTKWQESPISLQKGADGVWRAAVQLPSGTHHYRFLVDGEWRDDPECTLRAPNPFGGENMTRQVA